MSDGRRQAKQAYVAQPRIAGIFALTNTRTGRALLVSSINLKAARNRVNMNCSKGHTRARASSATLMLLVGSTSPSVRWWN